MKKFSVSVKKSMDDYTSTKDLWLTLNEDSDAYKIFKRDKKTELLIGIAEKHSNLSNLINSEEEDLLRFFENYGGRESDKSFLYIDTTAQTLKISQKIPLAIYIFRKKIGVLTKTDSARKEYSFATEDTLLIFDKALADHAQAEILSLLKSEHYISCFLMEELKRELSPKGVQPILIVEQKPKNPFSFQVKSSLNTVSMTVEMFKNKILQYNSDKIWQIETVLHEALVNAITYGNELDSEKRVVVKYEIGEGGLRVIIKDMGEGFDVSNISVPVGEEALDRISGRGIYIMQKFSEAMYFNHQGNEVMLFFSFQKV